MLRVRMGEYTTDSEKKDISEWVDEGTPEDGFSMVKPIFDRDYIKCPSLTSGLSVPPFITYEEVKKATGTDLGEPIKNLASLSHIHLFGIRFIFLTTGLIFSLSTMNLYLKFVQSPCLFLLSGSI